MKTNKENKKGYGSTKVTGRPMLDDKQLTGKWNILIFAGAVVAIIVIIAIVL